MTRSASIRRRPSEVGQPRHAPRTGWSDCGLPGWKLIWAGCAGQLCVRRVPPNWSAADWWEEMEAQGLATAWQALRDYDPTRGVPLLAFVHRRVGDSLWTRTRQEWTYARRCRCEDSPVADLGRTEEPTDPDDVLGGMLARLPEPQRRLMVRLFWNGATEAQIAREMGISQSAVNRRKRSILQNLRRRLERTVKLA